VGQDLSVLDIEHRNDGRVRVLVLNRPEALNAFDTALYNAAATALHDASADDKVRCVVVTGKGRAFSAGQDLGEMGRIGTGEQDGAAHGFPQFIDALMAFDKPLVAAVNGLGVGIGFTMLLHCDLVLLAHAARLRAPFVPLGVVPEAASSTLMPQVMGNQHASYYLYTGKWMSAQDAVDAGIAWKTVPDGKLLHETFTVTDEIAQMPTVSLVETKRLVNAARIDAVKAAEAREQDVFRRLAGAPANMEAITAFLEKRDPVF
jgi:enoyl-CoA hydratase/carnithine racemase